VQFVGGLLVLVGVVVVKAGEGSVPAAAGVDPLNVATPELPATGLPTTGRPAA
jgi:hypothetical protein